MHSCDANELENHTVLAAAFSDFIAASSRLEDSYRQLQQQVSDLSLELSARNADLNTSLAENERMRLHLQQIVDSMPCGVLVLAQDGQLSMLNPESSRLLGLDLDQFRAGSQRNLRQISSLNGINLDLPYEDEAGQEVCVSHSSGKRWLEVRRRVLLEGNKAGQTILILRDVSAQKRAEQEREAGRRAMALAEMSTILAHEIRNPLASLELFSELIETDESRRGEWISHLRAGIRSLSATVNNVLSFHGSGSSQLAPLPLAAAIGNAIHFVQPLADQAGVLLRWRSDHPQTLVSGNESAVQQVVLNLMANAIRHTPPGGVVDVGLSPDFAKDTVEVAFCDTGCGIRPDQMEHIFEPGYSGKGDSSGLGLAVCRRIMKQHNGSISATNGTPVGARFVLHFPLLQEELASA